MKIVFAKLHCEQSDYLIANTAAPLNCSELSKNICNRRSGIGADGVVFLHRYKNEYFAQQINSDGTHDILCDNALRCVAHYLSLQNEKANSFTFNSGDISQAATILSKGLIQTQINNISFDKEKIPVLKTMHKAINQLCEVHGEGVRLSAVSCHIPYAVVLCDNIDYIDIGQKGHQFQDSRTFQNGINVVFIQIVDNTCIRLKAYRAGCKQVPACGNAAAAAVYTANHLRLCGTQVNAVFDNSAMKVVLKKDSAVITAAAHFIGNFNFDEVNK